MKNLILVAVLLLIVSSLSFGQSASATATATVQGTFAITKTNDLNFGLVSLSSTKTIASNAVDAAAFAITGTPISQITVGVSPLTKLTCGTNDMTFTQVIPIYNTSNTQTGASNFSAIAGGTATTSGAGNLWVWVGGSVTVDGAQVAGTYTGTLSVAVTQP